MPANTTTLTPEQREAIYEAWIAALRSGLYKQGRHYLEADGEFCCLGVLCLVLHHHPELGIEMDRFVTPDGTAVYSAPDDPRRHHVPNSVADELGLLTTMPSAEHRGVNSVLVDLNDGKGASFAEIAQFIEDAVMPLLRTEGILSPAQQEAPQARRSEMTQHTPGPWKVIAVDWSPEGNARFEIEGITRTGMADARLIAAAPDLLEALQEIVSAADGEGWSQLDATFSKARAAIAKATGGAA